MKIINYLIKIFTNDWFVVKTYVANWISYEEHNGSEIKVSEQERKTYYRISYSKIRNKFKLETDGIHNKSTANVYETALIMKNKLNIDLLNGKSFEEIINILDDKKQIIEHLFEKYKKPFTNSFYKIIYDANAIKQYIYINDGIYFVFYNSIGVKSCYIGKNIQILKSEKLEKGSIYNIVGVDFTVKVLNRLFPHYDTNEFIEYVEKSLKLNEANESK